MRVTSVVALLVAVVGSVVFAQNVSYDLDRSVDFTKFKTYAWVAGTNAPDALNHGRIVRAIDSELTRKGLTRVDPTSQPDVFVAYHTTFDRDLRISGFSSGWGGYRWGASASHSARVDDIVVGTLVVDVVQSSSRLIVWRASAVKEIDVNAKPETRDKNITRAAGKIFRSFPSTIAGVR